MLPSVRAPLLVVALVAMLVAGCGSPSPSGPPSTGSGDPGPSSGPSTSAAPGSSTIPGTASPSPSATPTPEPTPTPVPTPTMAIAPLTGRLVRESYALRHPIAVMIDDLWAARPQSGLSQASVVWHAPAEAGIPRYMAIFAEGDPKAVGPIRSARYYYIGWAAEWKAVYAHVGGSPQALATLRSKGRGQLVYNADQFRWGTKYFWRIKQRYAPHNVYTDGKHLRALAKKLGATAPPGKAIWRFAEDAPLEARPVGGRIDVGYPHNKVRYKYDRKTNTYLRFVSGGKKDIDAAYKIQIAPKNVIVMVMRFGPLTGRGSGHGRLEARLVGSGPAWISTNGKTIKGTWKKSSVAGPTRFYDKKGALVTLTAGQTYVQVIPPGTPIKFTAGKPATSPSPGPSGSPGASASPGASTSPAPSPCPGS